MDPEFYVIPAPVVRRLMDHLDQSGDDELMGIMRESLLARLGEMEDANPAVGCLPLNDEEREQRDALLSETRRQYTGLKLRSRGGERPETG